MNAYSFLWKGKDPQGTVRSERITAENAQAAKAHLVDKGWTNLELVTDEISASARAGIEAADWMCEEPVTPNQELAFFEGKGPTMFTTWWDGLKQSKSTILILAALFAWGLYGNSRWLMIFGGAGLLFIVFLVPGLHLFFATSMRQYSRLNRFKVWGMWNEVLDCVEQLRKSSRLTRIGVGDVELTRCRAQALAGLGRLDDAVAEFAKLENSPKLPRFLYLSHLSSIYDVAKAYEQSMACRQEAAVEKPDNSSVWIDIAYGYVRGMNQPAKARAALERAQQYEITGLGKAYLPFLQGVICWRERNFAEAKANLEKALAGFGPFKHNDLVIGLILLAKSYLCAVHSALGNSSDAKRLLRETEQFLIANREDELLHACRSPAS